MSKERESTSEQKSEGAVRAQKARIRAQMKTLPLDVQDEIEKHCSENNNGEREGSHSRQAMTERALAYHKEFGTKRGSCEPVTDMSMPGDPEYGPTGNNQCACGKNTGHTLVVKCQACCTGKAVA